MSKDIILLGLISDTHGLVRPEARVALAGVDGIIHAGDVCTPQVIEELRRIAPVTVVRGNNDKGAWAETLNEVETIEAGGVSIRILHDLNELGDLSQPSDAGEIKVVISGHSHKPSIRLDRGVLFVNPGSAGPRRFKLPISLGFLEIKNGKCKARVQTLEVD